jgi:hypothetical protein
MPVSHLLSVREVLEVIREYEPRGVSTALLACELLAPELVVTSAMRLAHARGMVRQASWDPRPGEWLWGLTELGRERLSAAALATDSSVAA